MSKHNPLVDAEAEENLVACALESPALADDPRFRPGLFAACPSDWLAAIKSLRVSGSPVTPHSIAAELGDHDAQDMIEGFQMRYPGSNGDYLLGLLDDLCLRRDATSILSRGHDLLYDRDAETRGTLDSIEGEVLGLRKAESGDEFTDGSDVADVQEDMEWRESNPGKIRGLETGFPTLDRLIDGMRGGRSYVIGARPSVGKSAIAKDIIEHNILRGKKVALFTLEMKAVEVKQRMISSMSGVPMGVTRSRPYSTPEMDRIQDSMARLSKLHWKIYDRPRLDSDRFRSALRRLHRESGIDLVVLDYLQLIRGVGQMAKRERRLEVGEVSATCKEMAGELNIPILSLSQLKRDGSTFFDKDKKAYVMQKPKLDDLRESGDIEQDADVVGLLHRNQMDSASEAEMIVAKQRSGPCGIVDLDFIPHLTRFRENRHQQQL